jgi:hypothetical protein
MELIDIAIIGILVGHGGLGIAFGDTGIDAGAIAGQHLGDFMIRTTARSDGNCARNCDARRLLFAAGMRGSGMFIILQRNLPTPVACVENTQY